MASHNQRDDDEDFGSDFSGNHDSRGNKRSFSEIEDDDDDIFIGSKKCHTVVEETAMILSLQKSLESCKKALTTCQTDLEAAKSEIQKWHPASQCKPAVPADTTPEPKLMVNHIQTLKSSEDSLKEQMDQRFCKMHGQGNSVGGESSGTIGSSGNKVKWAREHGIFDYNGTDSCKIAKRWMEKAKEVLELLGVEESCKPGFVRYFLKGEAVQWWERMANNYGDDWTWANFQSEFTKNYAPVTSDQQKMVEFITLEQGGDSVSVYAAKFVKFSKFAPELSRRGACSMFMGGLNRKVRSRMEEKEYLDLDELVAIALEAESKVSQNQEHHESKHKKVQNNQEATRKAKRLRGSSCFCRPGSKFHSGCCPKATLTCFKCGGKGHYRSRCPSNG